MMVRSDEVVFGLAVRQGFMVTIGQVFGNGKETGVQVLQEVSDLF